ncbi:MAG: phosphatase PAP2 family protein [Agathobacter sp.]|nr:phosphatase PAP2 family protein [Agathobacter sp.]
MTRLKSFLEKNKHFALLLYFVIYLIWFKVIEEEVTTHFHVVHTALDDVIPFCEYFVIPYFLWFFYIAWGFLYFGFKDKKTFFRMCGFLFTGMSIFLIVSTAYPNGHFLRPMYFTRHNFCTMLCEYLYSIDTPTNLFPSIHVYNSLGVHMAVMTSEKFKERKVPKILSGVLCVSIILSTMLIKQHSTFDVFTALILGAIMYFVAFRYSWKHLPQTVSQKASSVHNI